MSPRRTSFIAGNWKMYKTIEEAERCLDPESFARIVEVASRLVAVAR
jgi:triosephosphate isomerase